MLILSLIVTTVVQILITLLSLRGQNLVQGVSRLFRQLDPAFTKTIADELSRKLLRHPAVVRSMGRVTQAISKKEFVRLANNMLQQSPWLEEPRPGLLMGLQLSDWLGKTFLFPPHGL